jgi:hypothetical protein
LEVLDIKRLTEIRVIPKIETIQKILQRYKQNDTKNDTSQMTTIQINETIQKLILNKFCDNYKKMTNICNTKNTGVSGKYGFAAK